MRLIKTNFLIVSFILTQVTQLFAQKITNPKNQSEELGNVHWYRNYDEAIALAKKDIAESPSRRGVALKLVMSQ